MSFDIFDMPNLNKLKNWCPSIISHLCTQAPLLPCIANNKHLCRAIYLLDKIVAVSRPRSMLGARIRISGIVRTLAFRLQPTTYSPHYTTIIPQYNFMNFTRTDRCLIDQLCFLLVSNVEKNRRMSKELLCGRIVTLSKYCCCNVCEAFSHCQLL